MKWSVTLLGNTYIIEALEDYQARREASRLFLKNHPDETKKMTVTDLMRLCSVKREEDKRLVENR